MRDMTDEVLAEGRRLWKQNKKLQQKLNEIRNNIIGLQRIYPLDRLAMELDVQADLIDQSPHAAGLDQLSDSEVVEVVAQSRTDALYLRRLEYDLISLNNIVNNRNSRAGKKYDPDNWRGERP